MSASSPDGHTLASLEAERARLSALLPVWNARGRGTYTLVATEQLAFFEPAAGGSLTLLRDGEPATGPDGTPALQTAHGVAAGMLEPPPSPPAPRAPAAPRGAPAPAPRVDLRGPLGSRPYEHITAYASPPRTNAPRAAPLASPRRQGA